MNRKEALYLVGGLGKPSKMPGKSYGIPAQECNVGSKLRNVEGSTCEGCYALKGMYRFRNVKNAQYKRLESISNPEWVDGMVVSIGSEKWFRWHDAGDLQSLQHLAKIARVAERTPNTMHWLPTRENGIVKEYLKLVGSFPSNLTVRVSAAMIDGKMPNFEHTSGVFTSKPQNNAYVCPAPKQDNECKDCRACWNKDIKSVTYHKH